MRARTRSPGLAALFVATACGWLQPMPEDAGLLIEHLDIEPRPADVDSMAQPATGPVIQIATGDVNSARFHFVVHRSGDDVCMAFGWENGRSSGCGAAAGGVDWSEVFGMMSLGGDGVTQDVSGVVSAAVADVWIELGSGTRARGVLIPLDAARIEGNAFMAFVPADAVPVAVLALDGDGNVIERFELGPVAPFPADGVNPTPAASRD